MNPQAAPSINNGPATPPSPAMQAAPNARAASVTAPRSPDAQPNISTAVNQIKAGDKFGAQNTMRQAVGLPAITPPPTIAKPQMSDAISRLKMGDRASAEAMMRSMVGLKKGGKASVSKSSKTSKSSSASKRGDGIASKGKTKGRMI